MTRLHKIEALAGEARYAVTFRRTDGAEQTAVVEVAGDDLDVAPASLPDGWARGSSAFDALSTAVSAIDRARSAGPKAAALADVAGGWDVMMGNVVLADGGPACTAHGPMAVADDGTYVCAECGARATLTA